MPIDRSEVRAALLEFFKPEDEDLPRFIDLFLIFLPVEAVAFNCPRTNREDGAKYQVLAIVTGSNEEDALVALSRYGMIIPGWRDTHPGDGRPAPSELAAARAMVATLARSCPRRSLVQWTNAAWNMGVAISRQVERGLGTGLGDVATRIARFFAVYSANPRVLDVAP